MSNIKSEGLFQLIKSLSKSEKRHFKLFASKHIIGSKNKYVKLFEAIDKQKEYDEEKIISSEKYIEHFSTLKTRLYEAILKSLRVYKSTSSVEMKLRNYMDDFETLFDKKLYHHCNVIIDRAMKITSDDKYDWYRLPFIKWSESIALTNRDFERMTKNKHYFFESKKEIYERLCNLDKYLDLFSQNKYNG